MFGQIRPRLFALAAVLLAAYKPVWAVDLPHYTGELFPRPQQVLSQWTTLPLDPTTVTIEIAADAPPAVVLARDLLQQRLDDVTGRASTDAAPIRIVLGTLDDDSVAAELASFSDVAGLVLPPEGYVIRVRQEASPAVIVAAGHDTRGAFYAAASVLQMIGEEADRAVLKMADLNDWPHWRRRFVSDRMPRRGEDLLLQALYKINGYTIQARHEWRNFTPDAQPKFTRFASWREALESMQPVARDAGLIDTMLMLHLYAAAPRQHPLFNTASEADIEALIARIRFAAEMGIGHIAILADDQTPLEQGVYILPHEDERERFGRNAGRAHGILMRRLYEELKPAFPGLQLSFCPAPYSLEHISRFDAAEQRRYLHDLAAELPPEVAIIWTGRLIEPPTVEREDFLEYSRLVLNQPTFLWDNVTAVRENNPRVPAFIMRYYDGFDADSNGTVYLNTFMYSRSWYQVLGLAAGDYYWNPEGFDTRQSHHAAAAKRFGPQAPEWIDRYHRLDEQASRLARHDPQGAEAVFDELRALFAEMRTAGVSTSFLERQLTRQEGIARAVRPEVTVSRTAESPMIDGELDDAAWRSAAAITPFEPFTPGEEIDRTEGRITHDDEALYLALRMHHNRPLKQPVGADRRDEPVFALSDAIEIFLSDQEEGGPLCQLVFDHMGNIFDQSPQMGGSRWNPDWSVATLKKDGVWQAEVRIPFASLTPPFGPSPSSGTTWFGNFCRNNVTHGQRSSWSSTHRARFSSDAYFGRIHFE